MTFTSRLLQCEGREIHLTDWPAKRTQRGTVLAWHGLARTGRDMDVLAEHLSQRGWRVICPDTVGRGLSQWSPDPKAEYQLAFYARLAHSICQQLGLHRVSWVGTSMGGAVGVVAGSGLLGAQASVCIDRLVLNDNAPQLVQAAIERIKSYAGTPHIFDTVAQLEAHFRNVYQPYGWLSDDQWRQLTLTSARRLANGQVTTHHDPAIMGQFFNWPDDYLTWLHYDALTMPVLCLRGEHSDLVLPDTIAEMRRRGPGARGTFHSVEVPNCGHAPALNVPDQLATVARFLESHW